MRIGDDDGPTTADDDVNDKSNIKANKKMKSISLSHVSMMISNEKAGYASWFTCPDVLFDLNKVTHTGVSNMLIYPKSECLNIVLGMIALVGGSFA